MLVYIQNLTRIVSVRETSAIRVKDVFTQVSAPVGAAVESTNAQLENSTCAVGFDRRNPKRQCCVSSSNDIVAAKEVKKPAAEIGPREATLRHTTKLVNEVGARQKDKVINSFGSTAAEEQESLAAMVAVLCEQQRFVPLLRAFELFTPTSPLLPFIRFLQVSSKYCSFIKISLDVLVNQFFFEEMFFILKISNVTLCAYYNEISTSHVFIKGFIQPSE